MSYLTHCTFFRVSSPFINMHFAYFIHIYLNVCICRHLGACVYCLQGSNAVFLSLFLFVFCLDMALSFVMLLLCALNCPLG